ncbi:MAG: cyclodeaminase/cyclohydrolase family protein, partial [Bacteroidota bacterium]
EKASRTAAIQDATKYAIEVPFKTMKAAYASFDIIEAMVETGNPNSVTDAGVGALCVRSAVLGAWLNVKINASGLKDKSFLDKLMTEADDLISLTNERERKILDAVKGKIK